MPSDDVDRCPTGINGIDVRLEGGIPYTLSVLLHGSPGCGAREFVHSILAYHAGRRASASFPWPRSRPPAKVHYFTIARPRSDILLEMSWLGERRRAIMDRVEFYDFSCKFNEENDLISRWIDQTTCINITTSEGLVGGLGRILDLVEKGSLLIIDSLSDLLTHPKISREEAVRFLRGLQLATNRWDSTVLLLHTSGTVPSVDENTLLDACDAAIRFTHRLHADGGHRYRLTFEHMRGLPVALTNLRHLDAVLTDGGMEVMALDRVL